MYCSNCGQLLKDGVNFCSNCGMKVTWPAAPSEPEVEAVAVQTETPEAAAETTETEVTADVSEPAAEAEPAAAEVTDTAADAVPEPEEDIAAEPVTDTVSEEPVPEAVTEEAVSEEAVPEVSEPEPEAVPEEKAEEAVSEEPEVPAAEVTETVPEETEAEPAASESEGTEAAPEQKTEEVPAGEEVTKTAEPAKKPKKDKKKPLKYGGIAAALVICGLLIYNMLPSTRYKRAVRAAEEYMAEGDYTAAAEEYEKALTIRPEDEAVSADASAAFVMVGTQMLDEEKFEETIAFTDRTIPLVQESDRAAVRLIGEDAYSYRTYEMVDAQDFAGAKAWLQEGIDKGYDLQDELEDVKTEEKYVDVVAAQKEFLKNITAKMDADDYEGALDLFRDGYGQLLADENTYGYRGPVMADISGSKYKKAGLYKEDGYYAVYYGDYSGTSREGNGIYMIYNPGGLFTLKVRCYSTGEWKGDMPNGTVTEYRKIYEGSDIKQDVVVKAVVKDGIYNGEVEWTQDGETYYGSYTDGVINVIDTTDPNGDANRVAMYNSDQTKWRYYTTDSSYTRVFGMVGFGLQ